MTGRMADSGNGDIMLSNSAAKDLVLQWLSLSASMMDWMAASGKVDYLIIAHTAGILTWGFSSLSVAMRDRMADSGNVDCLPSASAAEDLKPACSSTSVVMRSWMVESDNAERVARVLNRVVFYECTEPNVLTRETSGNEICLPSMLLLFSPC